MVPNRQKRPFRYHIMLNSSFYVILLFGLSFLVPEFGINYLEDFNSLIFSGVYLVLLIPFLIFSYKNIEDDKTLSVKLTNNKQTVQGEDPLEDRILGIICSAQKEFYKDIIAKLFVIIGLSGGLVTLSRVPKLDILLTKPLLLGFLLLVAFDVLVVRNIMIMAVTITFKTQLQQAILHERVIELMKTKPQPTGNK